MHRSFTGKPLRIGRGCQFYGKVNLGRNTILGDHIVIGYPKEARVQLIQQRGNLDESQIQSAFSDVTPTTIGSECRIASQVVIYEGTSVGDGVSMDDRSRIGFDCSIGNNTQIQYAAQICDRIMIGANCVISGFICDGSTIADHAIVFGTLVHEFTQPETAWGIVEAPPIIHEHAVVGFNAIVVGGVSVGQNSYVAAGAIVTRDVPPKCVAVGTNKFIPWNEWKGRKLSKAFWDRKNSEDE